MSLGCWGQDPFGGSPTKNPQVSAILRALSIWIVSPQVHKQHLYWASFNRLECRLNSHWPGSGRVPKQQLLPSRHVRVSGFQEGHHVGTPHDLGRLLNEL